MPLNFSGLDPANIALLAFTDPDRLAQLMAQSGIRPGTTGGAPGAATGPPTPLGPAPAPPATLPGSPIVPGPAAAGGAAPGVGVGPAASAPGAGAAPAVGGSIEKLVQALGAVQGLTPQQVPAQNIPNAPAPRPGAAFQPDPAALLRLLQLLPGGAGGGAGGQIPSLAQLIGGGR